MSLFNQYSFCNLQLYNQMKYEACIFKNVQFNIYNFSDKLKYKLVIAL